MKSPIATWKSVTLTFITAVVFYVLAYSLMSRWQTGQGPWRVEFATNSAGTPQIVIAQPALGISNVTVLFMGELLAATNHPGLVAFNKPRMPTPFGEVIFDDLLRQPGTVTLDLFGHEVELIPKQLALNRQPHGWTNNGVFALSAADKLPSGTPKPAKGGYRRYAGFSSTKYFCAIHGGPVVTISSTRNPHCATSAVNSIRVGCPSYFGLRPFSAFKSFRTPPKAR